MHPKSLLPVDIDTRKVRAELKQVLACIEKLRKQKPSRFESSPVWVRDSGRTGGRKQVWESNRLRYNLLIGGEPPPAAELEHLKARTTILCTILALAKGKFHATSMKISFNKYYPLSEKSWGRFPVDKMGVENQMSLIGTEYLEFVFDPGNKSMVEQNHPETEGLWNRFWESISAIRFW